MPTVVPTAPVASVSRRDAVDADGARGADLRADPTAELGEAPVHRAGAQLPHTERDLGA
jgi:hypothetical protein